jgi:tRNA(Leu) C34 or U34 (ribose-2'-O)-methylase TrmL
VRGYSAVGLYEPKSHQNVGSVLRAAQCFGTAMVATSGKRYQRSATDTMAAYRHLPLLNVDDVMSVIPYDCVPVAIEVTGKRILTEYTHPERAFYIFGPEDGSLPPSITAKCRDVVRIESGCLNLAMAVACVLYDRSVKVRK